MSNEWSKEHWERNDEAEEILKRLESVKITPYNHEEIRKMLIESAERCTEIIKADLAEIREAKNE